MLSSLTYLATSGRAVCRDSLFRIACSHAEATIGRPSMTARNKCELLEDTCLVNKQCVLPTAFLLMWAPERGNDDKWLISLYASSLSLSLSLSLSHTHTHTHTHYTHTHTHTQHRACKRLELTVTMPRLMADHASLSITYTQLLQHTNVMGPFEHLGLLLHGQALGKGVPKQNHGYIWHTI